MLVFYLTDNIRPQLTRSGDFQPSTFALQRSAGSVPSETQESVSARSLVSAGGDTFSPFVLESIQGSARSIAWLQPDSVSESANLTEASDCDVLIEEI